MSNTNWGGYRKGAGRKSIDDNKRKKGVTIYIKDDINEDIYKYGIGETFSEKAVEIIIAELKKRKEKDGE